MGLRKLQKFPDAQKINWISNFLRLTQSLLSVHLTFDLINPLWAQVLVSMKKYVDGINDELTPFVVVAVAASHVMKLNQTVCGCFQVITSEPTIQSNQPRVTT